MRLEIKQDATYKGDDWWEWSVWIDGKPEELDAVDHVVYRLHSTFPNPVRKRANRKESFRLTTAGWGNFRLYASVMLKDGSDVSLRHDLALQYPDGTVTPA